MSSEAERVADCLARDLRAGVFSPGSWLKQIELQKRYETGRAPVRKALEAMAGRRLIRYEKNRGYFVHPADDEDTLRILDLRIVLETGFARAICDGATSDRLLRLEDLARTFASLAATGSYDRLYEANLAFHRALLACAGNKHLIALVDELRLRTSPAPASQWRSGRARIARSADEHEMMLAAVRDHDATTLAQLMHLHILQ
ncbi:GntR family transcriptional regulator [Tropicimonas sp.]|uniref:GntR family transcriptional regulator n=1 Tax=Tropicimonas sp. TaxID=2067044 RepID=UPI003A87F8D1